MAQNGGQIKYGIGFDVDTSGLNKLKQSLSEIKKLTATQVQKMNFGMEIEEASDALDKIRKDAVKVEAALEKAFNKDLGTINVVKFRKELENIKLNELHANFSKAGAAGQSAFRNITTEILTTNMQLKQSHTLINKMAETMANTVKWGIASSVMNSFTGSVQTAYGYVKNLDTSLNNIRIVTEKSSEEMSQFAIQANKAAKALGQSTRSYTDAALIYYQQGLSEQDVQARAETTLKAANVTQQSTETVSEQLTAVWNGYKVSASEAELYVDKLAAVAATTASDLEELSVGMSKVASAASLMGVDIDQLNATLATVVSVTRQAPESVGTAFKTIYARMGDIEAGLDTETTLGDYTEKMKEIANINVLDTNNQLRDMGEVVEEVGNKWTTLSREQQIALSQVMAGTRQYNNLLSLFDNWDMYEEAVNTSANAMGTLQNQQDIYMESTEAHLQGLSTSMEDLYDSLLDNDTINNVADALAGLADLAGNFVDAIGGGQGVLLNFGSIATKVFSRNIAEGIMTSVNNIKGMISNTQQLKAETELLNQFQSQLFGKNDKDLENLIEKKKATIELRDVMSEAQQAQSNDMIKQINELQNLKQTSDENLKNTVEGLSKITKKEKIDASELTGADKEAYSELTEQLGIFEKKIEKSEKSLKVFNSAFEENLSKTKENTNWKERFNKKITDETDNIIKLAKASGGLEKEVNDLTAKQLVYQSVLNDGNATEKEKLEALEDYRNAYSNTVDALKRKYKEFQDATDPAKLSLGETLRQAEEDWDRFIINLKTTQVIHAFVNIAASIGQIAGAMQSLGNIDNILTDDSLSGWEKFIQIISILSMSIPQLISGFGGMGKEILKLTTIWATHIIKQEEAQQEAEKTRKAEEKLGNEVEETTEEIKEENEGLKQNAKEKDKVADKTDDLADKEKELGDSTDKTSEKMGKSGKLMSNLNTIAGKFGTNVKGLGIGLGALAAAIAIVSVGIGVLVSQYNKAANAAKLARESLENASVATEGLRNQIQETSDALESYTQIQETFKDLETNTKEWTTALKESNEQVLILLENIPKLAGYIENENGQLVISTEGIEYLENELAKQEYNVEAFELSNQIITAQKNYEESLVNARRKAGMDSGTGGSMSSGIASQSYYGTKQSSLSDTQVFNQAMELVVNGNYAFLKDVDSVMKAISGATENQAEKILKNADTILDLADEKLTLDDSILLKNELLASKALEQSEQYNYMSEEDQKAILKGATLELSKEAEALYENKYKDMWGGLTDETVQNLLKEALGAEDIENLLDNKFKLKVDGEWTDEITDEFARKYLAQMEASSDSAIDSLVNNYSRIIQSLGIETQKYKEAILSFAGGNLGDLSNLKTEEEIYEFLAIAEENLTYIDAIRLGFESVADALEALDLVAQERLDQIASAKEKINEEALTLLSQKTYEGSIAKEHVDKLITNGSSDIVINSTEEAYRASIEKGLGEIFEDIDFSKFDFSSEEILENLDNEKLKLIIDLYNEENLEGAKKLVDEAIEEAIKETEKKSKEEALENDFDTRAAELELDSDELDSYRELLAETYEELKDNQTALNEVALANKRMEKGVKTLASQWDSLNEIMTDSTSTNEDISTILPTIKDGLQDILNLNTEDFSLLPKTFAQDNWALIQDVMNGVEGAIDTLRNKAGEEILMTINGVVDPDGTLNAQINDLHNQIASFDQSQFTVGVAINPDEYKGFIDICNSIIQTAGMTAKQAQAYFASMGYNVKLKTVEQPITETWWDWVEEVTTSTVDLGNGDTTTKTSKTKIPTFNSKTATVGVLAVESITPTGSYGGGIGVKTTAPATSRPSSSGSSGGGGGGSSGSSAKKQTKKASENPKDRYRTVNNELSKLSTQIEKLAKAQDHLFGTDLSKNLEKQLKIIKDQVKWTKEKLTIAKQEKEELQKELKGLGVTFDSNNEIANYVELLDAKQKEIESLYASYNAATVDSDEEEAWEEKISKAEEARDELLELIDRYDEIMYDLIPELEESIIDMAYQQIEIQITEFNIEAELRLDLTEAIKDWADFKREVLDDLDEDDFSGFAKSYVEEMKSLMGSGLAELLTSDLNGTIKEIQDMTNNPTTYSGMYALKDDKGNLLFNDDGTVMVDEVAAMEQLKKDQEDLQDHLTDIKNLEEEINEQYLDSIDAIEEAYEAQIENFEFINDQLDHSLNMIELLKGEEAYEEMGKIFEQQANNYRTLLASQKQAVDYYAEMAAMETDPEAKEKWIELWKSATEELNETVASSVELLNQQYQNTISKALQDLEEAFGGKVAKAQWEIAVEEDEKYLDSINSMYEMQSFENKVKDSINNTDSLSAQKRLNKLLDDELSKLKEKDKLTQYDVDRANQLYEIELKKIALEEAQQNKSKMRLRRDASGNYSYQFVADEDAQAQAQKELDEAQNSLYNMDKDELKSKYEEMASLFEEYQDLMNEYASLSLEEREAREEEYALKRKNLEEQMTATAAEAQSVRENLNQSTYDSLFLLYDEDEEKFKNLTEPQKQELVDNLQPAFVGTMDTMINALTGEGGYQETWKIVDDAIKKANEEVDDGLKEIEKTLGLEEGSLKDITSDYYTTAINGANELIDRQDRQIEKYKEERTAVEQLKTEVEALKTEWLEVYQAATDALIASELLREQRNKEEAEKKAEEEKASTSSGSSNSNSSSSSGSSSTVTQGNNKIEIGDTVTFNSGVYTEDSYGGGLTGNSYLKDKVKINRINTNGSRPYHIATLKGGDLGWVKKSQISGYDTGGYTGDWESNIGKLAFLHEKELVLNKDDTKNMLAIIKMVRELTGFGNRVSTLDTGNEDESTQQFHSELTKIIKTMDSFREDFNLAEEISNLQLLKYFEDMKDILEDNPQIQELLDYTEKDIEYQELMLKQKETEIIELLKKSPLVNKEEQNSLVNNNNFEEKILILEENLLNSLNKIKNVVKDSFDNTLDKINHILNSNDIEDRINDYNNLKQDIVINAEFPNATKVDEIQMAFDNLVNIASQRAYSTSAIKRN